MLWDQHVALREWISLLALLVWKDIGGDMAVLDSTTIIPCYAGNIIFTRDAGISEGDIPDSAVNVAEETLT